MICNTSHIHNGLDRNISQLKSSLSSRSIGLKLYRPTIIYARQNCVHLRRESEVQATAWESHPPHQTPFLPPVVSDRLPSGSDCALEGKKEGRERERGQKEERQQTLYKGFVINCNCNISLPQEPTMC